jgi:hypothetical protein
MMSEGRKKGARTAPMFSSPIVSLTLHPLPSSRLRLLISLADSSLCIYPVSRGLY